MTEFDNAKVYFQVNYTSEETSAIQLEESYVVYCCIMTFNSYGDTVLLTTAKTKIQTIAEYEELKEEYLLHAEVDQMFLQ